jgi:hypothetical protein
MMELYEVDSNHPAVIAMTDAMRDAAMAVVNTQKLERPQCYIMLACALAKLVWESGLTHENIPPTVIQALLNMAVDAGMGERIGMVQMPGKGGTLQ